MNATANVRASVWERTLPWGLPALLVVGLLVRLLFINSEGFKTDVGTFQAWAMSAAQFGIGSFYSKAGFADYPPGYIYVLALIGDLYNAVFRAHDGSYTVLRALVKLPAVIADLGIGALIFAIGARFTRRDVAFGAAALYVLNPVTIYVSAVYGQVDSFAGVFALAAAYLLLLSSQGEGRRRAFWLTVASWSVFALGMLIKPQAAVLIPVFIAFAFVNAEQRRDRLVALAAGAAAGVLIAILFSEPFHAGNPIGTLEWLLQRYTFGSSVYDYNSVNAFNLWAVHGQLWVKDSEPIFGIPTSLWGIGLLIAGLALIVWRYVIEKTPRAFMEACALALIAFFMLSTRMHERYIFNGLIFAIAAVPFARRYVWVSLALSVTLYANLLYTMQYLDVVTNPGNFPGVNSQNLWGWPTSFYSLLGLAAFFFAGYGFLGENREPETVAVSSANAAASPSGPAVFDWSTVASWLHLRSWFNPAEGLKRLTAVDHVVMWGFGVVNFVVSFIGYWYPSQTDQCWTKAGLTKCGIFDEIYFARAAEEYASHQYIYESTHPPLSKLLVTLSMFLFGGAPAGHGWGGWPGLNLLIGHMADGDNTYGWRFLNVVFGAIAVMILFAFAKRVTGSTLFAGIAAALLTADGMHFVQSRIATPEGLVVVFATLAVYAFYRFWIASQTANRVYVPVSPLILGSSALASLVGGIGLMLAFSAYYHFDFATSIIVSAYFACGLYLLARYVVLPRFFGTDKRELSFPEGSFAFAGPQSTVMHTIDEGVIDSSSKNPRRGRFTSAKSGTLINTASGATITYETARVLYATPEATAASDGTAVVSGDAKESARSARLWLIVFTIALGLLVSSKWYGVMGFGVSFIAVIFVWLQRWFTDGRPALWGNPRGFRLDGVLVAILFISATVYALVWTPDMIRKAPGDVQGLNDVVYRQYSMFQYHDTLVATHPYQSQWWEWPLDYVPIAYYYKDDRPPNPDNAAREAEHGVKEITSLPNPFVLWFGLLAVPIVAFLAIREKNKGYALIVLTYLLQWVPWARSPRITFAYHFYVDIPLICLCNAIVLQKIWQWASISEQDSIKWGGRIAVGVYVLACIWAFTFFYPILTGADLTWTQWHHRMWMINDKWVVGPG